MQPPHRSIRIALAWLVPLAAGCGLTATLPGRFDAPQIQVHESKVESMSTTTARVALGLDVYNPNSYTLHVTQLRFLLRIGGVVLAEGESPQGFDLPPQASATVQFPADLHLEALAANAATALMLGEVPYELQTTLSVGTFFLQREIDGSQSSVLRFNLPLGLARMNERDLPTATSRS